MPEVVRGPESARRREVSRDLVTPGAAVRVFGRGQELDMREAVVHEVSRELLAQLPVGQALPPRPEMHLVHGHRCPQQVRRRAPIQPVPVGPVVRRGEDHASGAGRLLGGERERVGLLAPGTVLAEDLVLVRRAVPEVRHEQLPHAARAEAAHHGAAAVPAVEVGDQADGLRVRGPHRERGACHGADEARVLADVGTQDPPEVFVSALSDEVEVELAERGQIAIGLVDGMGLALIGDIEPVVRHLPLRPDCHPHAAALVGEGDAGLAGHERDGIGSVLQGADGYAVVVRVSAEDRVGVVVPSGGELLEVGDGHGRRLRRLLGRRWLRRGGLRAAVTALRSARRWFGGHVVSSDASPRDGNGRPSERLRPRNSATSRTRLSGWVARTLTSYSPLRPKRARSMASAVSSSPSRLGATNAMSKPAATVTSPYVLHATAKALSASVATNPPCTMPCPLTICFVAPMVTLAYPGATARSRMPRPTLATSSAHMTSAQ